MVEDQVHGHARGKSRPGEFIATGPSGEIPNNLHSIIIICGGVNLSLRG